MLKSLLMTTLFSLSGLVAYADVVSYQINGKMIELDKQVVDLGVQAGNIIKQRVPVKDEGIKANWLAVFSVFVVASYTHGNFVKKGLDDTQATEASLIAYFVSHDIPIIQGLAWLDSLPALDTSALTKTNGSESKGQVIYQVNGRGFAIDKQVVAKGVELGKLERQTKVIIKGTEPKWLFVYMSAITFNSYLEEFKDLGSQNVNAALIAYFTALDVGIEEGLTWLFGLPRLK